MHHRQCWVQEMASGQAFGFLSDPEYDVFLFSTAVSGVGSSPALATCETRQNLLAGVPGGFPGDTPVSPHLSIGSSLWVN